MYFKNGITIIGSGNVAWHLAHAFTNASIKINVVISRTEKNARELAEKINVGFSSNLNDVPTNSSLILLCVSDNAIAEVADNIKLQHIPIAHTAGSVALKVLAGELKEIGVFYPFQTFSKNIRMGELSFPVCIEAGNKEMLQKLELLALKISSKVYTIDSENRKYLHLAGVLANNFTNYLYTRAFDLLENKKIDKALLIPLIEETVARIKTNHPKELQTGPAKRGNVQIIKEHEQILGNISNLQPVYTLLSNSIMDYYNKKDEF